jgi:hypothetical protein
LKPFSSHCQLLLNEGSRNTAPWFGNKQLSGLATSNLVVWQQAAWQQQRRPMQITVCNTAIRHSNPPLKSATKIVAVSELATFPKNSTKLATKKVAGSETATQLLYVADLAGAKNLYACVQS